MATIDTITLSNNFNIMRQRCNTMIDRWNAIGEYNAINITGGAINGTTIGQSTPAVGTFSNLTVNSTMTLSSASLVLANDQISGDKISGGTIDNVTILLASAPTLTNHATTKAYVDAKTAAVEDQIIAFAIVFGG